jgi:NAD+ synthase/NAD+ synthase (glutamine-hydrolysing)
MKIALLQIDPTVGDLPGNAQLILEALRVARDGGADLAVTPELALVGYLPRDLLLNPGFVSRSWDALANLAGDAAASRPCSSAFPGNPSDQGRPLNRLRRCARRPRRHRFRKALLPTYDVFDEDR